MAIPQWGRMTYDNGKHPVPLKSYKCKATAVDQKRTLPGQTLTHQCKIGIDHDGDHECICGKAWPPLAGAHK